MVSLVEYIGPDKKRKYSVEYIYSTLQIRLLLCAAEHVVSQYGLYRLVQLRNWIQLENVSSDLSTGGLRALPIIVTGLALRDITRGKCKREFDSPQQN